jgi:branched-subunit amino acid transport protein AzlD
VSELAYLIGAIVVSAGVTWGLRALPFAALSRLRESRTVAYLGTVMPAGVMVILVLYCLRDLPSAGLRHSAVTLIAVAATVGLHLWRRSPVLSILGGTALYVALASTLLPR